MKKLLSIAIILLLLNTNFSLFAYAKEFNAERTEIAKEKNNEIIQLEEHSLPSSTFACGSDSLSDSEVQRFQELLRTGFEGSSFNAGTQPVRFREGLDNNSIVIPQIDQEGEERLAVKQDLPAEKITANEVSYLLNYYYQGGAFAFGLEINDDLRFGQCRELDGCYLSEGGLNVRNDGEGIKQDFKNVYEDAKRLLNLEGNEFSLSEEERARITTAVESVSETKELKAEKISRTNKNLIENSVKTDEFTASNATDCDNGLCTISMYSLFDKYFNSWFSAEMVVSNVGPTLIGKVGRMFNWFGNRGLAIDTPVKEIEKRFNLAQYDTDGLLKQVGQTRLQNARAIEQKHDLREFFSEYYAEGKVLTDSGIFGTLKEWQGPEGLITKIGKDAVRREAAFNLVNQRYGYTSYLRALSEEAKKTFDASPQTSTDIIEYAQKISKIIKSSDDNLALNMTDVYLKEGANDLKKYAIFNEQTKTHIPLIDNSRQFDKVNDALAARGNFDDLAEKLGRTDSGNLKLFKLSDDATTVGAPITFNDLELGIAQGKYFDLRARLSTGEIVNVSPANLEIIKNNTPPGGTIQLLKSGWVEATDRFPEGFSPLELSEGMLELLPSKIKKAEIGTGQLRSTLIEKGWTSRRTASYLDRELSRELNIVKAFFDPRSGATKWLAVPYLYWGLKRGGGIEGLSAYQLPDTWYEVQFYTDSDPIYDDAFIDFFSNSGSDQGDMFIRIINNLPYKFILNQAIERFNVLEEQWDGFTKGEVRSKVGNLAVYTAGPNECATCGITLSSLGAENFTASFNSNESMQSFILEDTPIKEKENGQTIITYSHHMNVKGNSEENQPINLAKSIREKQTCGDKIEEAFFGVIPKEAGASVGGILAAGETAGYLVFGFFPGIFGSLIQQVVIAPDLQDCVDVEEGYYTHFFIPEQVEEKKIESGTEKATQNISDLVKKGTDQTLELLEGGSASKEILQPLKDNIEELTGRPTKNKILEAIVKMQGATSGKMTGIYLFSFWVQGGSESSPTEYKTEGEKNIVGEDGKTVNVDFENGRITFEGKPIIESEDNVRLTSTNTAIPAEEIPNTITRISLPNSEELMFEMTTNSDMIVLSEDLLNCLKAGVLSQTGLQLKTNNLTEAFGKTVSIVTTTHPNVFVQEQRIVAEGSPRRIAEGNPKIQIQLNRHTLLLGDNIENPEIGLMKSIQFKNGLILFKPETNELIVWLKHHEDGIIAGNDVLDLKPIRTTTTNPLTGCEETAFDLRISGDPSSPFAQTKVEQFNNSLQHLGPYQIFDTETHRYIFYTDEDCQEHLRVINKETGEIYDQTINSVKQTPDGFNIATNDGREHDFSFGVDNGQPFIDYNGLKEILRSASGRNGSFYYDPNKGLFYAENAQLLPLNEAFKQQGINTQVNPDGTVSSTAGGNPLNINIGNQGNSPISLPALPENAMLLTLMISIIIASFVFIQLRKK